MKGILGNVLQPGRAAASQNPHHPTSLSPKIVLATLHPLHFHINFRISLLLPLKTKTTGFQLRLH